MRITVSLGIFLGLLSCSIVASAASCPTANMLGQKSGQNDYRINSSNFNMLGTTDPAYPPPTPDDVHHAIVASFQSFNNETESKAYISYTPSTAARACAGENVVRVRQHCNAKQVAYAAPRCTVLFSNVNRISLCANNDHGVVDWSVNDTVENPAPPFAIDMHGTMKHELQHSMGFDHDHSVPSVLSNIQPTTWRGRALYDYDLMCLESRYGLRNATIKVSAVGDDTSTVVTLGTGSNVSISQNLLGYTGYYNFWIKSSSLASYGFLLKYSYAVPTTSFPSGSAVSLPTGGHYRGAPLIALPHSADTELLKFSPDTISYYPGTGVAMEMRDVRWQQPHVTSMPSGSLYWVREGSNDPTPVRTLHRISYSPTGDDIEGVFAFVGDGRYRDWLHFARPYGSYFSIGSRLWVQIPVVRLGAKRGNNGEFSFADRRELKSAVSPGVICQNRLCTVYFVPTDDSLYRIRRALLVYSPSLQAFEILADDIITVGGAPLQTASAIAAYPRAGTTGAAYIAFQSMEPRFPIVRARHAVLSSTVTPSHVVQLSTRSITAPVVAAPTTGVSLSWLGWLQ